MLEQSALIFICQFVMIGLLGLQSLHVRDGQKIYAAITSLMLGIVGFNITGIISSVYHQGMFSTVFFAFVVAGPLGIVSSIWLHRRYSKEKK